MRLRAVWIGALGLLLGCGGEKPSVKADDAGAPDAGKKAVDSKIAAALEATGSPSSSASAGQKPPPNGVFGPGEADLAIAPNTPPKVELLGEGREPRFGFRPSAAAVLPRELTVEFVTQRAGQVSPQVSFRLAVGDGPLPAAPGASGKPAASGAPSAKPVASVAPTAKPAA
ncbi:MAG: hypothetical protein HY908_26110, partial [Myxococcales bacterium]|nr:hypothetical protein [Myxococcales bacterium]